MAERPLKVVPCPFLVLGIPVLIRLSLRGPVMAMEACFVFQSWFSGLVRKSAYIEDMGA